MSCLLSFISSCQCQFNLTVAKTIKSYLILRINWTATLRLLEVEAGNATDKRVDTYENDTCFLMLYTAQPIVGAGRPAETLSLCETVYQLHSYGR